jgi:hypothetical protein
MATTTTTPTPAAAPSPQLDLFNIFKAVGNTELNQKLKFPRERKGNPKRRAVALVLTSPK